MVRTIRTFRMATIRIVRTMHEFRPASFKPGGPGWPRSSDQPIMRPGSEGRWRPLEHAAVFVFGTDTVGAVAGAGRKRLRADVRTVVSRLTAPSARSQEFTSRRPSWLKRAWSCVSVLASRSASRRRLPTIRAAVTVGRVTTVIRICHVRTRRPATGRRAFGTACVTPCPPGRPEEYLLLVKATGAPRRAR